MEKNTAAEMLPCPMPDCVDGIVGTGRVPSGMITVSCGRCVVSVAGDTTADAISKWNKLPRASHPAPQAAAEGVALTVWYGSLPESNGKSNFTAILNRKDAKGLDVFGGITIEQSEYPDRVRYEADRMRFLIGEIDTEPCILDYDADKHSGYAATERPAIPAHGQSGMTRLDLMSLIRSQMHRCYTAGHEGDEIDPKYITEMEDAVNGIYHGRYIAGYDLRKVEDRAAQEQAASCPDGWKLVPIEPTEDMIVDGFESAPCEGFTPIDEFEAYEAMSGCQQAAHRARLCYVAMLAAAPSHQENAE